MQEIKLRDEFIKLGQALKAANLVQDGVEAKFVIQDGLVTVNGEVIVDGNIRKACKGHNIAPDGSNENPYTVDHRNHPGLFRKSGLISFCGHGAGVKFRNIRIKDLSK